MNYYAGPWTTSIHLGSSLALSAAWRQRMGRLCLVSRTRSGMSGPQRLLVALVGCALGVLPTFRAAPLVAEEAKTPVSSVHVTAEMRTLPSDNFALIGPTYDFVTVEVWKEFSGKRKWRVEKPGRVVTMDGSTTLGFLRPNFAFRLPFPAQDALDCGGLLQLAQDQEGLAHLTKTARSRGWDVKQNTEETAAGEKQIVLTVLVKSRLPEGDYSKNKWLSADSDTRNVYRFDARTQRLAQAEVYLRLPAGEKLILRTRRIEYNVAFDSQLFTQQLPKDVHWAKETVRLPDNAKYERMTPAEMVRAFFDACRRQDWAEAEKFWPMGPLGAEFKDYLGGLTIVQLGEPFQSQGYAAGKGWYVPYEIRLKDGAVKKYNLAVRKDNPANRLVVDGGI